MFNLSPIYSARKSSNNKLSKKHKISLAYFTLLLLIVLFDWDLLDLIKLYRLLFIYNNISYLFFFYISAAYNL